MQNRGLKHQSLNFVTNTMFYRTTNESEICTDISPSLYNANNMTMLYETLITTWVSFVIIILDLILQTRLYNQVKDDPLYWISDTVYDWTPAGYHML